MTNPFIRIPFYPWIRAIFLLYLIAPQTQGAKILYQQHVHPFLEEHENAIEDFITSAHDRAKTAGLNYLKQAFELFKEHALGLPPAKPSPAETPAAMSYTQSLIARFNLPNARPTFPATGTSRAAGAASTATDFYALLSSAVSAATSAGIRSSYSNTDGPSRDLSNSGTLIPPSMAGADRMSFIAAQREKLSILLSALDKEASELKAEDSTQKSKSNRVPSMLFDGASNLDEDTPMGLDGVRPASAMSVRSGMSKSRSELDFEKIEKDESANEERPVIRERSGSWLPWSWGTKSAESAIPANSVDMRDTEADKAKSSGLEI